MLAVHLLGKSAYSFDCTFFRLICLTAKALRRMVGFCSSALASCVALPPASMQSCKTGIQYVLYITMRGSHAAPPCAAPLRGGLQQCKSAVLPICLVGATELEKRTLKQVQLRILGL